MISHVTTKDNVPVHHIHLQNTASANHIFKVCKMINFEVKQPTQIDLH